MKDFGSREDRARTPTKGLRQRLRVELKRLGFKHKFRTDELRHTNTLVVMTKDKTCTSLPLKQFEGHEVKLCVTTL